MNSRLLRRKVIMREYDYTKTKDLALTSELYDRAEFIPLNQFGLERLRLLEILKGKESPLSDSTLSVDEPAMLIYKLKDYLYSDRYYQWNVSLDDEGYLCVQARRNTPKTRLGMAIFEKDLKCRI